MSAELYAPAFEELRTQHMGVVLEDRSAQIQRAFYARARSVDENGGPAMEYGDWTIFCRKASIIGQKVRGGGRRPAAQSLRPRADRGKREEGRMLGPGP